MVLSIRGSLWGGTSVVGRTNVNIEITGQEHHDVLMVLFNLKQLVCLCDEQYMVYIVKPEKKTLHKYMIEQGLSMTQIFNLMTVSQKPIKKKVISKYDGTMLSTPTFKYDGTLMSKPDSKSDSTLMSKPDSESDGKLMREPDSESDGTPMCTPMGTMGSKSEGTPAGTHNFKFDDTVMGTPMDTSPSPVFYSPNGRS